MYSELFACQIRQLCERGRKKNTRKWNKDCPFVSALLDVNTTRKRARFRKWLVDRASESGAHDLSPNGCLPEQIIPKPFIPVDLIPNDTVFQTTPFHTASYSERFTFQGTSHRTASYTINDFNPKQTHIPERLHSKTTTYSKKKKKASAPKTSPL